MKKIIFYGILQIAFFLTAFFTQQFLFAQDSTVSTTTHSVTKTTQFVIEPWMWIVGGVVVLLILIGLFSGGRSKNEVVKTTVIKERL